MSRLTLQELNFLKRVYNSQPSFLTGGTYFVRNTEEELAQNLEKKCLVYLTKSTGITPSTIVSLTRETKEDFFEGLFN